MLRVESRSTRQWIRHPLGDFCNPCLKSLLAQVKPGGTLASEILSESGSAPGANALF
jgi:hypothetical protein